MAEMPSLHTIVVNLAVKELWPTNAFEELPVDMHGRPWTPEEIRPLGAKQQGKLLPSHVQMQDHGAEMAGNIPSLRNMLVNIRCGKDRRTGSGRVSVGQLEARPLRNEGGINIETDVTWHNDEWLRSYCSRLQIEHDLWTDNVPQLFVPLGERDCDCSVCFALLSEQKLAFWHELYH